MCPLIRSAVNPTPLFLFIICLSAPVYHPLVSCSSWIFSYHKHHYITTLANNFLIITGVASSHKDDDLDELRWFRSCTHYTIAPTSAIVTHRARFHQAFLHPFKTCKQTHHDWGKMSIKQFTSLKTSQAKVFIVINYIVFWGSNCFSKYIKKRSFHDDRWTGFISGCINTLWIVVLTVWEECQHRCYHSGLEGAEGT